MALRQHHRTNPDLQAPTLSYPQTSAFAVLSMFRWTGKQDPKQADLTALSKGLDQGPPQVPFHLNYSMWEASAERFTNLRFVARPGLYSHAYFSRQVLPHSSYSITWWSHSSPRQDILLPAPFTNRDFPKDAKLPKPHKNQTEAHETDGLECGGTYSRWH